METTTQTNPSTKEEKKTPYSKPLEIKNIHGKALILKGIVSKITPLTSQFGYSWSILMEHGSSYYLNGKSEDLASRLFTVGKLAAFTVAEKPNRRNPDRPFLVIDQVLYTFE